MSIKSILLIGVVALVVASCASDSSETLPSDDGVAPGAQTESPIDPGDGIGDGSESGDLPVVSPDLAREIDVALADLAERLGDDALLGVTVAFELTWPDSSLGCPEPDTGYQQVLTDGYLIELTDGTNTYPYHGALGGDPFLCEQVTFVEEPPTDTTVIDREDIVDASLEELAALAVADLAAELGVPTEEIEVEVVERVTWRDGSYGCPQPDMSYTQALTPGSRFQLSHEDASFWYHQGGDQPPFPCEDPQEPAPGSGDA